MNYLEPIRYYGNDTKAEQTIKWKKCYGYDVFQTTHNIMYNIDAIMSLTAYGCPIYVFNDGSELIEYPDRGLIAFKP